MRNVSKNTFCEFYYSAFRVNEALTRCAIAVDEIAHSHLSTVEFFEVKTNETVLFTVVFNKLVVKI